MHALEKNDEEDNNANNQEVFYASDRDITSLAVKIKEQS